MSDEDFKDEDTLTQTDENFSVDVDEFDKVVGDALDSVEAYTEQDDAATGELKSRSSNLLTVSLSMR